jgi:hypothetical protein
VEPGEHRVRFEFRPRSWTLGLAISAMTAVALLGWSVFVIVRRRISPQHSPSSQEG